MQAAAARSICLRNLLSPSRSQSACSLAPPLFTLCRPLLPRLRSVEFRFSAQAPECRSPPSVCRFFSFPVPRSTRDPLVFPSLPPPLPLTNLPRQRAGLHAPGPPHRTNKSPARHWGRSGSLTGAAPPAAPGQGQREARAEASSITISIAARSPRRGPDNMVRAGDYGEKYWAGKCLGREGGMRGAVRPAAASPVRPIRVEGVQARSWTPNIRPGGRPIARKSESRIFE